MRSVRHAAAGLLIAFPFCSANSQVIPGHLSQSNPGFNDITGAVYGFYIISAEKNTGVG